MKPVCEHHFFVESAEQPDNLGRRMVILACDKCGQKIQKITARSTKQIEAELDAQ